MARQKKKDPLRILVGISGGIAAYKLPQLVRELRKRGCETKVVLTGSARPLVGEEALRTVSGNPVFSDTAPTAYDMDHIRLAQWASVMLICPATANTIAKIAHGIADNLLTTLALAFDGPVVVAPAMNSAMWKKEVTRRNVSALAARGMQVLPVEDGELACGDSGPGRMLNIESIVDSVLSAGQPKILAGTRVLIGSGPTAEPIDSVRLITNRSSGKMGSALAREALAMGAKVTVVTGPSAAPVPGGAHCIRVTTSEEMMSALEKCFDSADVCIMAAAVSDFRPAKPSPTKLGRKQTRRMSLALAPTADILGELGRRKKNRFVVGFALEDSRDVERAARKMRDKNCDMMVLNQVASALGTDSSSATILRPKEKPQRLPTMTKQSLAREILTRVGAALGKK